MQPLMWNNIISLQPASSQTECLNRYKQLLGIESGSADNNNNQPDNSTSTDNGAPNNVTGSSDVSEPTVADAETNLTITDIKYIDINGNTSHLCD